MAGQDSAISDIFISYNNQDLIRAQMFAEALEGRGWSIFWDRTIPIGKTWRQTIGKELSEARCVIVLWSKTSVESNWVQEESDDATRRGILVPVLIENVVPPIGFRSIQAADLAIWDPTEPRPAFNRLLADIAALIGSAPATEPAPPPHAKEPRPTPSTTGSPPIEELPSSPPPKEPPPSLSPPPEQKIPPSPTSISPPSPRVISHE